MAITSAELRSLPELEWEGEAAEGEFFRRLADLARRGVPSPALRRLAARARRAVSTAGLIGRAISLGIHGPPMDVLPPEPPRIEAPRERRPRPGIEPPEEEWEGEAPTPSASALMEHLGHEAARARSEAEAEAFVGALIPLAARLIPRVAPAVMRAAPGLIRGVSNAARLLRRNPATRPLVRALPHVVRRTAATMARQASGGRPITPQSAVRTLADQTYRVLSEPRQCVAAYRRSRALDTTYHRAAPQGWDEDADEDGDAE
jgi:hypothetical protein